jgi:hypothetical protein
MYDIYVKRKSKKKSQEITNEIKIFFILVVALLTTIMMIAYFTERTRAAGTMQLAMILNWILVPTNTPTPTPLPIPTSYSGSSPIIAVPNSTGDVVTGTHSDTTNYAPTSNAAAPNFGSYNLPPPDGGAQTYLNRLKTNDNAKWAAKSLLNAERNAASKGFTVLPYLTTAWLWFENGSSGFPDPYEINCNDSPSLSAVSLYCDSSNFQIGGYQAASRKGDYVTVYRKFYSDSDLITVLQTIVNNSSHAIRDSWRYTSSSQQESGLMTYLQGTTVPSDITINNISPNSNFFGQKGQFFTLILGKDPNIVIALNSYAVSTNDLVRALGGSGYGYIHAPEKQILANMIQALYLFDTGQ